MVEKMGHKNRMKMMRMEWINEGKSKAVHEDSLFDEPVLPPRENGEREKTAPRVAPIFANLTIKRPKTPVPGEDVEMDDLYDATPRVLRQREAETRPGAADSQDSLFGGGASIFGPAKTTTVGEEYPEDDLDALLAEEEPTKPISTVNKSLAPQEVEFDDEMEAMAEMESMW
jgi:replication fork protection complex subunit Csm3/Swi3